jgi:hypothetical protein
MIKKGLLLLIFSLIFVKSVNANLILPYLEQTYVISILLFIPIVLIETFFVFYLAKKIFYFDLNFWLSLLAIFIGNLISTLLGFLSVTSLRYSFLADIFRIKNPAIILVAYILSTFIEGGIIYAFIKNKIEKPFNMSMKLSLIINFITYMIIFLSIFFIA